MTLTRKERRKGIQMQVDFEELDALLNIQRIDLLVMQAKKRRAELPQRVKVQMLRKKRDEISAKLDQALDIEKQAKADFTKVEDEDRQLADKQKRAQELIDTAGSDYRKVESQSKEMAGIAKRRDTLATKMIDMQANLDKIENVRSQLENAIAASQAEEKKLRSSFEAEDNEIIANVKMLMEKRNEFAATLSPDVLALYERTAAKTGGVALGKLEEGRCGVCRTPIEGGRLIELRAAAPLGTCPVCKRLLIVE